MVDGVLWRTRTGSPWRDLPVGYGSWKTVYNRHRRWSADGTWEVVLAELQRGCDAEEEEWSLGIDSTVVRAHHHAAGAPHAMPTDVPAERLAVALDGYVSKTATSSTGGCIELQGSGQRDRFDS